MTCSPEVNKTIEAHAILLSKAINIVRRDEIEDAKTYYWDSANKLSDEVWPLMGSSSPGLERAGVGLREGARQEV